MSLQDYFKLVLHSLKLRTRDEYSTKHSQFPDFFEDEEITIERPEQFDRVLWHYINYVFEYPGRDGRGHVNKVLYTMKLYIPESKNKLHLSHRAMIGWACVKPSQEKTRCT